ncbi:MAG: DoxX family protein [Myxococcota bacterium]
MQATLDHTLPTTSPTTARRRWAGRILTAVPALFLTFDAVMKLVGGAAVDEANARLGLPGGGLTAAIGLLELACLALYVVPRTAALGALLLTGFLGGAVALHVRVGDPLASHALFPVYVGALLWAGLYLRDARVRALVGARR